MDSHTSQWAYNFVTLVVGFSALGALFGSVLGMSILDCFADQSIWCVVRFVGLGTPSVAITLGAVQVRTLICASDELARVSFQPGAVDS